MDVSWIFYKMDIFVTRKVNELRSCSDIYYFELSYVGREWLRLFGVWTMSLNRKMRWLWDKQLWVGKWNYDLNNAIHSSSPPLFSIVPHSYTIWVLCRDDGEGKSTWKLKPNLNLICEKSSSLETFSLKSVKWREEMGRWACASS